MKISNCRLCGSTFHFDETKYRYQHYCRTPAPGAELSCKQLRLRQTQGAKQTREKKLAADLNGGVSLGKHNKDLTERLKPLTLRSYAEVGKIMALSPQAVRLIELRALAKIRAALMPFKKATGGGAKITQVTVPIASLED